MQKAVSASDFAIYGNIVLVQHQDNLLIITISSTILLYKLNKRGVMLIQVQGAVMLAGLFETITGFCGLFGTTKRWLGPLTIGPVIFVLGLSLLKVVLVKCSTMWWISLL